MTPDEIREWLQRHHWYIEYHEDEEPVGDAMIYSLDITDQNGSVIVEANDVVDGKRLADFYRQAIKLIEQLSGNDTWGR